MAAFERARAEGARAVELDVLVSADGECVVFHDETLARMTAGRDVRPVHAVPLAELLRTDLGNGARIPTLAEVLRWARSAGVAVNVELKHEVPSRAVLVRGAALAIRESGADVLLSSFDPLLLVLAGAFMPPVPRAFLTEKARPWWAAAVQGTARPLLLRALHLERTEADPRVIARYLGRGLRLGAWTVNDPREARALVALGVASIITDQPGEMLRALAT
jgi:glycerophosphoryl diester phosphodiesterase